MNAKDVMIQISECAQISKEHSLKAAIIMLSAVRRRLRNTEFRPRGRGHRKDARRAVPPPAGKGRRYDDRSHPSF